MWPVIAPTDFIFIISFTVSFQNSIVIIARIQCWADFQQESHVTGPTLAQTVIWWFPPGTLKFYDCYYKAGPRRVWVSSLSFWVLYNHHPLLYWDTSHIHDAVWVRDVPQSQCAAGTMKYWEHLCSHKGNPESVRNGAPFASRPPEPLRASAALSESVDWLCCLLYLSSLNYCHGAFLTHSCCLVDRYFAFFSQPNTIPL